MQITDAMVDAAADKLAALDDPFSWLSNKDQNELMRAALSAALSEQTLPVRVEIKELEWSDGAPGTYKEIAESPFGHYSVWEINGTACWSPWKAGSGFIVDGGLEAAKAAAQQDYETRIRSALVDNSHASEAVVEKLRDLLDVALEALDNYSDPTSYTDNNGEQLLADYDVHPGLLARDTASSIRAALSSLRPAEVGSATSSCGTGGGE